MRKLSLMWAGLLFLLIGCGTALADDILIADFEGEDYGTWKVEGESFGTKPAQGTLPGQMEVRGYLGTGLVNSFYGQDTPTGKITSPEFRIERPYITFLIGGGGHPGTHMDLIVDGQVVRTAAGPNVVDGGSETLDWMSWDVAEFQGKNAVIQIVDQETGGWGHINVDQIMMTETSKNYIDQKCDLTIEKRYLLLPVKDGGIQTWFRIESEGNIEYEFVIELVEENPDFYACLNVEKWRGKTLTLVAERTREGSRPFAGITQSDERPDAETAYKEKYRPQYHFSPRFGWTNDPNGLVYYDGEYHLFYQHNPFGVRWNNMTWGHAVGTDLLHWDEGDDAIRPDELGTIFSGSAVVDWNNTAGLQTGDEKTLIAIYTYNGPSMRYGHRASQGMAYSNDRGRTWTKYAKNPILFHIIGGNRDPKVFWHEESQKWIMPLYMEGEDYALFGSENLREWSKLCDIKNLGCSECPDMFELPVDGRVDQTKWVFWGADGKYLIGHFDGITFTPESEPLMAKYGGNDYAAQSYSNTPGRRIQFSWMSGGVYPNMPFNQQFSVPRELTLRTTPDGIRLCTNPVVELESLRGDSLRKTDIALGEKTEIPIFDDELLDLVMTVKPGNAKKLTFDIRGQKFEFLLDEKQIVSGDVIAPAAPIDGKLTVRILMDRMSMELFVNDGLTEIAQCFVPEDNASYPNLEVSSDGSDAVLENLEVWKLQSVYAK